MSKPEIPPRGPWIVVGTEDSNAYWLLDTVEHENGRLSPEVICANARLMEAAPEMLKALEFVQMTFYDIEASKRKGYYERVPKIVADAIAGATQQTAPSDEPEQTPKQRI